MSDIVERLRSVGGYFDKAAFENGVSCAETADVIETLRQRVKELEASRDKYMDLADLKTAELATLKQGQGEPVAWMYIPDSTDIEGRALNFDDELYTEQKKNCIPLYLSAPTIPAGWQLVPIRPTEKMLNIAYLRVESEGISTTTWMRNEIYSAMLSAAPKPGEPA